MIIKLYDSEKETSSQIAISIAQGGLHWKIERLIDGDLFRPDLNTFIVCYLFDFDLTHRQYIEIKKLNETYKNFGFIKRFADSLFEVNELSDNEDECIEIDLDEIIFEITNF